MRTAELLIGGHFVGGVCDQTTPKQVVKDPFDGSTVGVAAEGGRQELLGCIEAAHEAFGSWRNSPRHARQKLLRDIAGKVRERANELSDILTREVGKPISWSRGEVSRLALTFDYAADLLSTWGVAQLPVDMDPRGEGYRCFVDRFPVGVVFCITPYNWPYNLAAHKIAPALATGNTVVLKPSPQSSISTLTMARLIHEAGCPPGVVNAWNGDTPLVAEALHDPRVKIVSFTGSEAVGWQIKEATPGKKVSLELGGDASAVVMPDADLDWAVKRIVSGGYGYAGQVCISIQHVLIHRSVYEEAVDKLTKATDACPTGDPKLEDTVCGPLISESAVRRVTQWVDEARSAEAKVLAGGGVEGNVMRPTLLEAVPDGTKLSTEEVFGPVLTVRPFDDLDEAIERVDRSRFGIHCGIFTQNIRWAEDAYRRLDVGAVIVDDYPTLRFDNMPYGGQRRSGFGREGLAYAMDEYTEPKAMVVRVRPL